MLKSMTGFGQGEAKSEYYLVKVEIKAVNHRYLDIFVRLPKQYAFLEESLRPIVQKRIGRGRIEVTANVQEFGEEKRNVKVNRALLDGYLQALHSVQAEIGAEEEISLDHLLSLPDLLEVEEHEIDSESLQQLFSQGLNMALDSLDAMRIAEGKRLQADLLAKAELVENLVAKIGELAPEVVVDYRRRLKERLGELLDGTNITEERFLGEVAIFADRCSIDEELVRLASHIQQFKNSLHSNETIGRKLDFLIIEMNREVNTIGSKANSLPITSLVVEVKSELEKIREQVQNIE